MVKPSRLDDRDVAAHAWRRFRLLMVWMAMISTIAAVVAIVFLRMRHPDASVHLYIAAALGVFASVMLGTALMGLVFMSSGTEHDDAIEDPLADDETP